MKKTILLLIIIFSVVVVIAKKRYSFLEIHKKSRWDKYTRIDSIKHVNSPALKVDSVWRDSEGWLNEVRIKKIEVVYIE